MTVEKKKIIFVNNNMELGGVQKALVDLLAELDGKYDVSLLLFSCTGPYMEQIPNSVRILSGGFLFRCLGVSQKQSGGNPFLFASRTVLAAVTKLFGRKAAMKIILGSQKILSDTYDAAISFLQNGAEKSFYGGCNEFVLKKIRANRKIAFIHCDYGHSGANTRENNELYQQFDKIAACSEGCRKAFLECIPQLQNRCRVVTNCHNFERIRSCAAVDPVTYPRDGLNLVTVARLGHEKGIERGIHAVAAAVRQGLRLHYYVVGKGPMREKLEALIQNLELQEQVVLCGGTVNPYRFISKADLLLIPSSHEAAPLVIDEAAALGVPVLSTKTTSAQEMVAGRNLGWVCENTQEGLNQAVEDLARHLEKITLCKSQLAQYPCSNAAAVQEFCSVLEQ